MSMSSYAIPVLIVSIDAFSGAAVGQWLVCWLCNPEVAGSILRSSSLSDETVNRGPISMT